MTKTRNQFQ